MAEPTLAIPFAELLSKLGDWAGYGFGVDFGDEAWDADQRRTLEGCVKAGLHDFYYCGHDWSFLKPVAALTLSSGENTVALPDDFGQLPDSQIVVSIPSQGAGYSIPFGGFEAVYGREATGPDTTGRPLCAVAEPVKGTTGATSQRSQLHVWPTADQDYTLTFPYSINPDFLTGTKPYAYGGPQHAQTVMQACKAAFERDVDNVGQDGPMQVDFKNRLEASKLMDRRNKPHNLGVNRDLSDLRRRQDRTGRMLLPVIVQGSIPT